jgi:hypothetical protein
MLALVDSLHAGTLTKVQREAAWALRAGILALVEQMVLWATFSDRNRVDPGQIEWVGPQSQSSAQSEQSYAGRRRCMAGSRMIGREV